ncbi:MAG: WecB/TagA/CpsF family glycosyltransferase [Candidatus Alkaliphilus sp. MAG34]|nr:WecB/TagA/CpsF family glycosyltransferase [Clostridiales bacterium]
MRETEKIMGISIDRVNMEEAYNRFKMFMGKNKLHTIYTPNTEIIMMAQHDYELKEILNTGDLVIPDGIGLVYASKILGKQLKERVTGVDLMTRILQYCNKEERSIFILGGKPGIAELATKNITKVFPQIEIKGVRDGYFKEEEEQCIIDTINTLEPDVLFVALGVPRQEKWINKHHLKVRVAMGVGGSIDIWAGTVKRAPIFFQRLGLEWLYRLFKEPWRYRRMAVLPKFLINVIINKNRQRD